ncbi:hypothetical protein HMPREF1548_05340 [Clostridium sp. KLE 1755]|nr:hypothetical protein HMPREF1548_05340 [Clostridium sp. KLE 1755]
MKEGVWQSSRALYRNLQGDSGDEVGKYDIYMNWHEFIFS